MRFFRIKQINYRTATPDGAHRTTSAFGHLTANGRGSNFVWGVRQRLILQMLSTKQKAGGLKVMKKFIHSESTAAPQRPRGSDPAQKSFDYTVGCRQTRMAPAHRPAGLDVAQL